MTDTGAVYYMSSSDLTTTLSGGNIQSSLAQSHIIFEGTQTSEQFGYDLLLQDFDGDDVEELWVGSPFYSQTSFEGTVSIFSIPIQAGSYTEPITRFVGDWPNGRFGAVIATASDLNIADVDGDGNDDILVSAPNRNADRGAVFIINSTLTEPVLLWEGELEGEELGSEILIHDINGDGLADVIVGAAKNSMDSIEAGAVYIALGPVVAGYWDAIFYGTSDFERLGQSLASYDGGFWVGAPGYDLAAGAVWNIRWE